MWQAEAGESVKGRLTVQIANMTALPFDRRLVRCRDRGPRAASRARVAQGAG